MDSEESKWKAAAEEEERESEGGEVKEEEEIDRKEEGEEQGNSEKKGWALEGMEERERAKVKEREKEGDGERASDGSQIWTRKVNWARSVEVRKRMASIFREYSKTSLDILGKREGRKDLMKTEVEEERGRFEGEGVETVQCGVWRS